MAPARKRRQFDAQSFLESAGFAKQVVSYARKEVVFSQGDPCNDVLYVRSGAIQLSVLSSAGKEAVIGGEEHIEEGGREPEPVPKRDVTGFESASVNKIVRDESGQHADEDNGGEEQVAEEKFRDVRNCGSAGE